MVMTHVANDRVARDAEKVGKSVSSPMAITKRGSPTITRTTWCFRASGAEAVEDPGEPVICVGSSSVAQQLSIPTSLSYRPGQPSQRGSNL